MAQQDAPDTRAREGHSIHLVLSFLSWPQYDQHKNDNTKWTENTLIHFALDDCSS
jgi:hypothetical protein